MKHVKHSDLNLLSGCPCPPQRSVSFGTGMQTTGDAQITRQGPTTRSSNLSKDGVMMTYVEPTHYFYSFPLDGSFLVHINLGSKSTKNSASALSQKAGPRRLLCAWQHPPLGKLRVSIESIELPLLDLGVAAASAEANRVLQRSKG